MDSRKALDVENLIVIMKAQGMDTRNVEDFVEEIRAEREAENEKALTTANSEGPQN
ncbi:MAG TPA: hypothetical protein VEZ13_13480 [Brevibacillus sp.]|nr:hypothetical protein [Brevibacillus sp.]